MCNTHDFYLFKLINYSFLKNFNKKEGQKNYKMIEIFKVYEWRCFEGFYDFFFKSHK